MSGLAASSALRPALTRPASAPTTLTLLTCATFAPLRAWAVAASADPALTIVVPRRHLRDELLSACLTAHGPRQALAARVLTTAELLRGAQDRLEGEFQLTGVMRREIVRGLLQQQGETALSIAWPGSWQPDTAQPTDWVVDRVSGLFEQLTMSRTTIAQLRRLARQESDPTQRARKRLLSQIYRQWLRLLTDVGLFPDTEGVRRAAMTVAQQPRPSWVGDRVLFLGFDGAWAGSAELRLLEQLVAPSAWHLAELRVALVSPERDQPRGWDAHGNDALEATMLAAQASIERLDAESVPGRSAALQALHQDPTAYASEPADWDARQVRVIRYADPQQEARAIADRIKRLCVNEGRQPDEIAVIGRGLGSQSALLQRALREVGVPVVASGQTRLRDVPAIQYLRAWAELASVGPRLDVLERLSGTGYWGGGRLDLTTLREAQTQWGLDLASWTEWRDALKLLGGPAATAAQTLLDRLAAEQDAAWPAMAPIAQRVAGLRAWLLQTDFERQIHSLPARVPASMIAVHDLVRADLDAVQTCVVALEGWVRGAELARTAAAALSAAGFAAGLERITAEETIRLSTWGEDGVSLIDPHQAILRQWPIVFVLGLTDGAWPARPDPLLEEWDAAARRMLGLRSESERLAHDRLVFHAACAAATEQLELSAPATDAQGAALGVSPYVTGLGLRLLGAEVAPALQTIRDWAPREAAGATSDLQTALAAAREARQGVVDPWLFGPTGRQVVTQWQQEAWRTGQLATLDPTSARFQTQIAELMPEIWPETKPFTPGDLELYRSCPTRFWHQRVLGLQSSDTQVGDEETPALAGMMREVFGPLAHEIDAARSRGAAGAADLDPVRVLTRLEQQVQQVSARARGRIGAGLWQLDQEPLVDTFQQFVQREWLRGLEAQGVGLRTKLIGTNLELGTLDQPLVLQQPGTSRPWLLQARVDRLEQVDDPRLTNHPKLAAVNGMLVVTQYRPVQSRAAYVQMWQRWLSGQSLQLPLLAKAASLYSGGARVFGLVERTPLLPTDPRPLLVRDVQEGPQGEIEMVAPDLGKKGVGTTEGAKRNPVQQAMDVALGVATEQVEGIRRGDFAPPTDPPCWTCPLARSCRASVRPDGAMVRRRRAPLPLAVSRIGGAAAGH